MLSKPAETRVPIHPLLQTRWSPRAFDRRAISPEVQLSLFEAARWAASSNNEQPWRFIVATQAQPAAYEKLFAVLKEGNQMWAQNAPLLMLAITKHSRNGAPNKNARHDLGLAVAQLTVQAAAQGLVVRQMGGIYEDAARAAYNIPDDYDILNAIAIGYPAAHDVLPPHLQERELAPRSRKPLEEIFFSEWEQPAEILSPRDGAQAAD